MEEYFQLTSKKLKDDPELIKKYFSIHANENGRNKEDLLASFLRSHLPNRYAVGTGFVINSSDVNRISNQTDTDSKSIGRIFVYGLLCQNHPDARRVATA